MSVIRYSGDVPAADLRRVAPDPPFEAVAEIIESVRSRGDAALAELEQRFNPEAGALIEPVPPAQLESALAAIDADLRAALELAIANVRTVSETQLPAQKSAELSQGQVVSSRPVPVGSAAAYVPGGRGSYPSTAIMCAIPAQTAGVERIALITPAREQGAIDPTVAAVCALLGVTEVHAFGGAQGIAALALGTESIDPVDVIVGPGNSYVQEAKRQLYGTVGIDGVAGPSELAIVADASANPAHIALDLLAQAEHGPDSIMVLASDEPDLLDTVEVLLGEVEAPVALVSTATIEAAIELADELAPEHMQICCELESARSLAQRVTRAGCLFVGHNGATAFGDYVAGSNHVLPTGGAARFSGPLSTATFMRRMSVVEVPDGALGDLSRAGARIAGAEGFDAHGRSMSERAANLADG